MPSSPAFAQTEFRQTGHEVQLRRPRVAEPHRVHSYAPLRDEEVVRRNLLRHRVVPGHTEDDATVLHAMRLHPLVPIPAGHVGYERFDHEHATFPQAPGNVREAAYLILLREQSEEGIEDDVHDGESSFDVNFGEVPDGHG